MQLDVLTPAKTVRSIPSARRMGWVDFAKGLAIIFVVYRHSIVGIERSGREVSELIYFFQEVVFNFRMPVFFVLSGIFLQRAMVKRTSTKIFIQKIKTLLYPYFLWSVIFISIQIVLSDYTNSQRTIKDYSYILFQPRNLDHMWYLLALFNTSWLLLLLNRLFNKTPVIHLVLAFILHMLSYKVSSMSLISDVFYHYIFLVIGVQISPLLFRTYRDGPKDLKFKLVLLLPLFIAGQYFWLNNKLSGQVFYAMQLVIILFACYYFYLFCRLANDSLFSRTIARIGKYSLYIYILHFLIIASLTIIIEKIWPFYPVEVLLLLSLGLGIVLPILIFKFGEGFGIRYLFSLPPFDIKKHG